MKKVTTKVKEPKAPKVVDVVEAAPAVFIPALGELCWFAGKDEPWLGSVESLDPLVVIKHTRRDAVHRTEEVAVDLKDFDVTPATTEEEYEHLH